MQAPGTQVMDEVAVRRALIRIAHEIIEKNRGTEDICLVGILRRGMPLANLLRDNITTFEQTVLPIGSVDIRCYRDDVADTTQMPQLGKTQVDFDITGKRVVLVDDVLFTGRTARAAIDAVFALGRPMSIQLAVLIDRGHRELPIRADYVGKNIPTSLQEMVAVSIPPYDGETGVTLYKP